MRQITPGIRPAIIGVLAAHTPGAPWIASEEPVEWFRHTAENAWLIPFDPTLIDRWASTELSYEDDAGGASTFEIKPSFRDAFSLHDKLGLGYQLQLPFKQNDNGSDHVSGVGDFEARVGLVGRFLPTLRWGAAINTRFDSASEPALGDQAFQLKSIFAVRWDTTDRITLGFNTEYTFTPCDEGAFDVSNLELKFPFAVRLSEHWGRRSHLQARVKFSNQRSQADLGPRRQLCLWPRTQIRAFLRARAATHFPRPRPEGLLGIHLPFPITCYA